MNDLDYILDFAATLGQRMLGCGANLERVNDTMNRICLSYRLTDISIFSLSSTIILSAQTADNQSATRHVMVPPANNDMKRISRFNQLSRQVCSETPPPAALDAMLKQADSEVKDYATVTIILGYLIAMSSICMLNGGSLRDVIAADLTTVALFWIIRLLDKPGLNRIVTDALCMWIVGSLDILLVRIGLGQHLATIIITNSMMMIPGIPLVNAVRNILCGNEMNGILEILKIVLDATAIVLGLGISIYMFGGGITW